MIEHNSRDIDDQARIASGEMIGALLRGERMTAGLSLDDVHNRLRISPNIIEAFENNDLDSIGRPQFLAGYIRSYAKLLGLNPEIVLDAYEDQCDLVRMKSHHSPVKKIGQNGLQFANSRVSWTDRFHKFSHTTSLALPLVFVFVFIGAAVYGFAKFMNNVQQLEIVPTESRPLAQTENTMPEINVDAISNVSEYPSINYDELYKRQALQTPVVTPRSGRIADVNPNTVGVFSQDAPEGALLETDIAQADLTQTDLSQPDLTQPDLTTSGEAVSPLVSVGPTIPQIELIPVGESWVRLTNTDGDVLMEKLLQPGEVLPVAINEQVPILRKAGNASELYVRVNGQVYGPIGVDGASVVNNVPLTPDAIATSYQAAPTELLLNLQEKEKSYLAKVEGEQ